MKKNHGVHIHSLCNFSKKNRKGSHVGVVLSFVIFIAFLFFIFTVLQPKLNLGGKNKQGIVDYLKIELTNNFTSNFTTIYVNVTKSHIQGQSCVILDDFLTNAAPITSRLIVRNESDTNQSSVVDSGNLGIVLGNPDNRFFKIYESKDFNDITGHSFPKCKHLKITEDYSFTFEKIEQYVFETSINATMQNYKNNYPSLKKTFNVPSDSEFGVIFRNAEGVINQPSYNITQNSNVYTDDFPVLYIGKDGYLKSGSLEILVW